MVFWCVTQYFIKLLINIVSMYTIELLINKRLYFFQANQYPKSQPSATKGLASSFGFKKPSQTNKIRPISAPVNPTTKPIEKSDNCGSKMLPKPTLTPIEKCPKSIPKSNTASPNRCYILILEFCCFNEKCFSFLGLDFVNHL